MYTIIKGLDNKFHCEGGLQDGVERWEEKTLSTAVKSMIMFALTCNNDKIKKKDITYLQSVEVIGSKLVKWEPYKPETKTTDTTII